MMTVLGASDLTVTVAFGAVGALLVALATFGVDLIIDAVGDGDAIGDVRRFVELSEAARYSLLPHGPLLSDPDGEARAAIGELLAKKEQARRALWSSREAAAFAATPGDRSSASAVVQVRGSVSVTIPEGASRSGSVSRAAASTWMRGWGGGVCS
jgi:hypothetical protein